MDPVHTHTHTKRFTMRQVADSSSQSLIFIVVVLGFFVVWDGPDPSLHRMMMKYADVFFFVFLVKLYFVLLLG